MSSTCPIREKDGGHEDYLYVEDTDGLLACVQMGTIEFHGWDSHVDALEKARPHGVRSSTPTRGSTSPM